MPLSFKEVTYIYSPDTPFAYQALDNINVEIKEGKITALIGSTGSGKTTLVQHLNALLLPTKGSIEVLDRTIQAQQKLTDIKGLRKKVGLVFQFPEYQLFEETVLKDVAFGPLNFGTDPKEAYAKSKGMLRLVGLEEEYDQKSPLELSGGQKRKVAIAGILAMEPDVLVLDEPVAGLDPASSKRMMQLFTILNKKYNKTVIIVTHNMEHVLSYCDEVIVMHEGKVICQQETKSFFRQENLLEELRIAPPMIIKAKKELMDAGIAVDPSVLTIEELVASLKKVVKS